MGYTDVDASMWTVPSQRIDPTNGRTYILTNVRTVTAQNRWAFYGVYIS
jgi:hypothetical protein